MLKRPERTISTRGQIRKRQTRPEKMNLAIKLCKFDRNAILFLELISMRLNLQIKPQFNLILFCYINYLS